MDNWEILLIIAAVMNIVVAFVLPGFEGAANLLVGLACLVAYIILE
jgi:hypothetical protein